MSQTIIALVGPDKCGKTEIANELSAKLKIPLFKANTEKGKFRNGDDFINEMRYADPRTIDLLRQTGYSLILDRAWPCEWVYSRAFNRATDEAATRQSDIDYADLGAIVIICHRTSYAGLVDEDAPEKLVEPMLQKLHSLYEKFAQQSKCRVMFLNVDDENLEREVSDILSFLGVS
jgi:thymidylate kinase